MPITFEPPCEVTGKPCRWEYCCDVCEETFCADCGRDRDWSLAETEEE